MAPKRETSPPRRDPPSATRTFHGLGGGAGSSGSSGWASEANGHIDTAKATSTTPDPIFPPIQLIHLPTTITPLDFEHGRARALVPTPIRESNLYIDGAFVLRAEPDFFVRIPSEEQGMEETVAEAMEEVIALVSTWGLQVVGAIVVLVLGRWISGALRNAARRALERGDVDATLVPFLSGIVYYVALAVVLIAVLGLFGIETTSLVAVLGAAGLAIGLALQGTLSNFSSGVMLLVFRPFKNGDFVEVAGTSGTVSEIGIFTTVLNKPDNVKVIVPNSAIYGATITNYSAYDTRRNDLLMGVSYDDDLSVAKATIERVLASDDRVLRDPEPLVAVAELADSSVNFVVRPWCNASAYWALRFDLTRKLKEELEAAGCSIPYPQHDVHLDGPAQSAGGSA